VSHLVKHVRGDKNRAGNDESFELWLALSGGPNSGYREKWHHDQSRRSPRENL
jgi:hypothetical protein